MMEYVITFKNTNHVIKAEQTLIKCGIEVGVMPLPSRIRAGCGLCLRIEPKMAGEALKEFDAKGIVCDAIYSKIIEDDKSKFEMINMEEI